MCVGGERAASKPASVKPRGKINHALCTTTPSPTAHRMYRAYDVCTYLRRWGKGIGSCQPPHSPMGGERVAERPQHASADPGTERNSHHATHPITYHACRIYDQIPLQERKTHVTKINHTTPQVVLHTCTPHGWAPHLHTSWMGGGSRQSPSAHDPDSQAGLAAAPGRLPGLRGIHAWHPRIPSGEAPTVQQRARPSETQVVAGPPGLQTRNL